MPVNPLFLMHLRMIPFAPAIKYIPITLTNSQSSATPAPFQQLINIDPATIGSSYFSSDLGNIRFYADSAFTQPLYAWVESGNSNTSTSTNIWVNLPNGIPANSSTTIYMQLLSVGTEYDGVYMGEAPQLSSTYGQYDDGASVFNNYWNFVGTSTPSGWTQYNCAVSYNNGVTISSSQGGTYWYYTGATYSGTILVEEMMKVITQSSVNNWGEGAVGLTTTSPSWASTFSVTRVQQGTNPTIGYTFAGTGGETSTEFEPVGSFGIIGFYASSSGMAVYSNYQTIETTSSSTVPSSYYLVGAEVDTSSQIFVQWLRIRAYPSNGVMPTVSIGSIA